jgi:hypothetical protein
VLIDLSLLSWVQNDVNQFGLFFLTKSLTQLASVSQSLVFPAVMQRLKIPKDTRGQLGWPALSQKLLNRKTSQRFGRT